jgi:hypothetical protein
MEGKISLQNDVKCVNCDKVKNGGSHFEIYCGKRTDVDSEADFRTRVIHKNKTVIVRYKLDNLLREWVCDECANRNKKKGISLLFLSFIIFAIPYMAINSWLIINTFWSWGWEFVFSILICDIIIFLPLFKFTRRYYKKRVKNSGYYITRKHVLEKYGLNESDVKGIEPEYKLIYPEEWKKGYEVYGFPDS